jgi:hypothetical protein
MPGAMPGVLSFPIVPAADLSKQNNPGPIQKQNMAQKTWSFFSGKN